MSGKKAVIDIGTNSIKFAVAERDGAGYKMLRDENDIARLGEGLSDTGVIGAEPLERNARAVEKFVAIAKENGAEEIAVVGTMALRKAKNTEDFRARVKELCGADVRVIPGEEEARLAFVATASVSNGQDCVVFDTGGGSTEFIYGSKGEIVKKFSLNVGAVRLTEHFFNADPVAAGSVEKACADIKASLREGGVEPHNGVLIGMGGTVTSMASVKHKLAEYNPDIVHASTMTKQDVEEQINQYEKRTIEERRKIVGLQPKRADVILAGACIVNVLMGSLGVGEFIVSDQGLRHGLLFEMFSKK